MNESAGLEKRGEARAAAQGGKRSDGLDSYVPGSNGSVPLYLAEIIGNPTYRNEMLYKVAESMASGSASIANEYRRSRRHPSPRDPPPPPAAGCPGCRRHAKPPAAAASRRRAAQTRPRSKPIDIDGDCRKRPMTILIESFDVAKKIDRLIWKYRAMVRIALLAADSEQYTRGLRAGAGNRERRVAGRGHAAPGRSTGP